MYLYFVEMQNADTIRKFLLALVFWWSLYKPVEITILTRSKSFIVKYLFKYFYNLISQDEDGGSCEAITAIPN